MELVYLYVEEYKNIRNQGFTFSPRFDVEFEPQLDKDGKVVGGDLTIDENKEYHSVFPDNINITAIVGKNGSGKTSLIKIILMLIFYKKFQPIHITNTTERIINKEKTQIQNNYVDNFLLIIEQKGELRKLTIGEKYNNIKYREMETLDFFTIHFNYMLDTLYDNHKDYWVKSIYHRNDNYATPILLEPYKNADNEEKIDLKVIEYLNNQRILKFYNNIKSNKLINRFFNPNKIRVFDPEINEWGLKREPKEGNTTQYNYSYEISSMNKLSYKVQKIYSLDISRERMGHILDSIKQLYKNKEVLNKNKLYIALKLLHSNYYKELLKEQIQTIKNYFQNSRNFRAKDVIPKVLKIIDDKLIEIIIKNNNNSYENEKINRCALFHLQYNKKNFQTTFNESVKQRKIDISSLPESFYQFVPPWLEVEFYEDNKSIKSLSSGQKNLFTFLINILYQLSNISYKNEYQTINLFLDETDIGLHPEWQRRYLDEIVFSISKIWKKHTNIYFLTHSPFILSDIPKENIIFLDVYEEDITDKDEIEQKKGNCKLVDIDINTFGANIHTLLSHGFFMEDGLMGEFAKSKIDDVIKYLNNPNDPKSTIKDLDEAQRYVDIIGEPIIKRQLQKMIDSKRLSGYDKIDGRIKDLEYELSILKENQRKSVKDELLDRGKRNYTKKKDE